MDYNKYKIPRNKTGWKILIVTDGKENKGTSPIKTLKHLQNGERGLNLIESILFAVAYPEVLKDHAIDVLGSKYGKECIPTLFQWKDRKYLSAICPDVHDKMCGAPIVISERNFSLKK